MKNLYRILNLLRDWKWHFLGSSVLLIVGIFIRMLEPKIFQVAIDYVVPMALGSKDTVPEASDFVVAFLIRFIELFSDLSVLKVLLILAAAYMLISIFRAVFEFIAKTINAYATEKGTELLRNKFFAHLQHLPMDYFPTISTGELIQRSTGDIETIRRFIGNQAVEVLRLTAIFVFASMWLFQGNFWFGMIAISIVPFIAISGYVFFKKEQKVWKIHEDEADKLNGIAQENLSGIRVVKAFAQEEEEIESFEKQNKTKLNIALQHAKLHTMFWPFSDFLVHAQIIISIFTGGYLTIQQVISPGELVSFYTYIVMVAWPLRQVGRLLSDMGMALVAMDRIQSVLDAPEERDDNATTRDLGMLKKIEFRDVWFAFEEGEAYQLKGVNITINAGESVAILGPTGSGKSTLTKLLLRFYEPTKGVILINDIPINQISKKVIRQKVGLILQQAFLFTDTVKGNIAYATKEVSDERIKTIAALSGLDEIENMFVAGFDTMVGEKGVTLSGGQKQRVSIARTLLQEPDILILDDVTSAVDSVTEANILSKLGEELSQKTTLVITHRLTAIPYVARIIIMNEGELDDMGTHKELLERNKFYQEVHEIQNLVEREIDDVKEDK